MNNSSLQSKVNNLDEDDLENLKEWLKSKASSYQSDTLKTFGNANLRKSEDDKSKNKTVKKIDMKNSMETFKIINNLLNDFSKENIIKFISQKWKIKNNFKNDFIEYINDLSKKGKNHSSEKARVSKFCSGTRTFSLNIK